MLYMYSMYFCIFGRTNKRSYTCNDRCRNVTFEEKRGKQGTSKGVNGSQHVRIHEQACVIRIEGG